MSLEAFINEARAHGRYNDTELVHMDKGEVAALRQMAQHHGGDLTINPTTGLPEAGFLSSILPMVAGVGLAAMGVPAPLAAMAVGGGTAMFTGSLQKGLTAGLGAFGGAGIGNSLANAGASAASDAAAASQLSNLGLSGGSAIPAAQMGGFGQGLGAMGDFASTTAQATLPQAAAPGFMGSLSNMGSGLQSLVSNPGQTLDAMGGLKSVGMNAGMAAAPMLAGGLGGLGGQEPEPFVDPNRGFVRPFDFQRSRVENPQPGQRAFNTSFTARPAQRPEAFRGYAQGGLPGAMVHGRQVKGAGDGLSDSIPAMIDGVQPAAIAQDEFIVPADVVSQLGNGSSDAGAKVLDEMMGRIRMAAHGKPRQQAPVNPQQVLPA